MGTGAEGTLLDNSLRMIWGLLIVLGVILILYAFLKKRFSLLTFSSDQRINVIEIRPVMPKKSLCIVEVDGKEFLLGISNEHIQHVATLSKQETATFAQSLESAKTENIS